MGRPLSIPLPQIDRALREEFDELITEHHGHHLSHARLAEIAAVVSWWRSGRRL